MELLIGIVDRDRDLEDVLMKVPRSKRATRLQWPDEPGGDLAV